MPTPSTRPGFAHLAGDEPGRWTRRSRPAWLILPARARCRHDVGVQSLVGWRVYESEGGEVSTGTTCDEQALTLRDQGRTFIHIAEILGLDHAQAAHAAFNRGLRLRPRAERGQLRTREEARLDAITARVRGRKELSVEELVRRLNDLKRQRRALYID